jgi:primase-polymerase (primpol)-like protein
MTSPTSRHQTIAAALSSSHPDWLPVIVENIPADLVGDPSWYPALIKPKIGKPGKWDKIPGDPETAAAATWSDPATRCTFDVAYMAYQRDSRFTGIGYMMHGDGLVGIDLDTCVSPDGTIAPWAAEIVEQFAGAYWERSVSGTGLRGFCRGVLPDGVDGRRSKIEGCSVEVYSGQRFLVVTGQVVRP